MPEIKLDDIYMLVGSLVVDRYHEASALKKQLDFNKKTIEQLQKRILQLESERDVLQQELNRLANNERTGEG